LLCFQCSQDTEVIVWDIVGERGLHRLSGHKGAITQALFMAGHDVLISSAKDSFVKFWDLETAHCFKTLTAHKAEVRTNQGL
jgi:U3 small nucleolar RNA-associated protein 12